jgi:hypothetical protein
VNPPKYPALYEINTRVWLESLSVSPVRKATFDDIPDASLDEIAAMGFVWIWLLSVWTTGPTGQKISRTNKEWRKEFEETFDDVKEEDIGGSGFAIAGYYVSTDIGGEDALARLRQRLRDRGIKLMLDFVPNHMGPDHPWVHDHPEYFISGTPLDLENHPLNYTCLDNNKDGRIFAYGRDPYFSGWPDTIQLDYSHSGVVQAMKDELLHIAGQCDGVRCDMAMVILPELFEKTWGRKALSFWPEAIQTVREKNPDFCFLAEVYWDMEWTMQQLGFDYAYDKRLYDRLKEGTARNVREHFKAGLDFQDKLARFLENHDEPRVANTFDLKKHEAAAILTFLSPGLRFFHQGQLDGRKKRISPHLVRGPFEVEDLAIQKFYGRLLNVLKTPVFGVGLWSLLECIPAWENNGSWNNFVAFAWQDANRNLSIVVVNYAEDNSQCYLHLPFPDIAFGQWKLHDVMHDVTFERNGHELITKGLYLGMKPWQYHVFEVRK